MVDVEPERILRKGRLEAGTMIIVDTEDGELMENDTLQDLVANKHDYNAWIDGNAVFLDDMVKGSRYAGKIPTIRYVFFNSIFRSFHS